jgi:hypothetical protein
MAARIALTAGQQKAAVPFLFGTADVQIFRQAVLLWILDGPCLEIQRGFPPAALLLLTVCVSLLTRVSGFPQRPHPTFSGFPNDGYSPSSLALPRMGLTHTAPVVQGILTPFILADSLPFRAFAEHGCTTVMQY